MILWGWGERVLTFDLAEHEHCQRCEQEQDFTLRLKYTYGHFYHLFRMGYLQAVPAHLPRLLPRLDS